MRGHRITMVALLLIAAWVAGFGATAALASNLEELARLHAPVLRQDTASDQDYITRFDFDGDWDGGNNWENQSRYPLEAWVYWSGIETSTHVFLTYAWFHPRDYARWQRLGNLIGQSGAHENDLEGALLILEKRVAGPIPVVLETIFHSQFKKYSLESRYRAQDGVELKGKRVRFERGEGGKHPILEMESHGHGVSAWDARDFPGGDGVVYRVGDRAEEPENDDDRDVSYRLVDIESTLWARRYETGEGQTFAKTDWFGGERFGYAFRGYDYGRHKANAPWGWTDKATPLPRGTLFLDPARLLAYHFKVPGKLGRRYLSNPFEVQPFVYVFRPRGSTIVSADARSSGLLGN